MMKVREIETSNIYRQQYHIEEERYKEEEEEGKKLATRYIYARLPLRCRASLSYYA